MLSSGILKEEHKMTRQEAEIKVANCNGNFVKALEALGLLKFEEEKKKFVNITHHHLINSSTSVVDIDYVIEALRRIDIICVKKEP